LPYDPATRTLRRGQTEGLRFAVEFAQRETRLGTHGSRGRIDAYTFHSREVDHQTIVTHGLARDAVTSTTYRDKDVVLAGEPNASDYVGRASTAR